MLNCVTHWKKLLDLKKLHLKGGSLVLQRKKKVVLFKNRSKTFQDYKTRFVFCSHLISFIHIQYDMYVADLKVSENQESCNMVDIILQLLPCKQNMWQGLIMSDTNTSDVLHVYMFGRRQKVFARVQDKCWPCLICVTFLSCRPLTAAANDKRSLKSQSGVSPPPPHYSAEGRPSEDRSRRLGLHRPGIVITCCTSIHPVLRWGIVSGINRKTKDLYIGLNVLQ